MILNNVIRKLNQNYMYFRLKRNLKKQNQFITIDEIRSKTLQFIERMHIEGESYGQYKYSEYQNKPLLYSSVYAALTRDLYNDLKNLSTSSRKSWIAYIQSHQSEDGLFRDPLIENDIASKIDWWGWRHLTLHALMALCTLSSKAKNEMKIIEPFKDYDFTIGWLENRAWDKDPANVSNEIQNYTTFLQYSRDFQKNQWAGKSVKWILNWLDDKQDPKTGLWGNKFDSPYHLSQGVQTGYHLWLLYFYDNRHLNYIDKIVEYCLKTQNSLGGYGVALNSSACEDIDSIDPIIRLYPHTNISKNKIINSSKRGLDWNLLNFNENGGFVFRRREAFEYGHHNMYTGPDESAMFPTWFRTLTLAYLSKILDDDRVNYKWKFIKCPGHQFWTD